MFAEESKSVGQEQLGVHLLLTSQVAKNEKVSVRSVERWITKGGLPAETATQAQIGQLVSLGLLKAIPAHGRIYLIRQTDLRLIPKIRAYPTGTTRPRRGKHTGAKDADKGRGE